jgi:hypothetical protein
MVAALEQGRTMAAITAGISGDVAIDGRSVNALAGQSFRGPLLLTPINGRLPGTSHEITLGATTMRQVGAHVGSTDCPAHGARPARRATRVRRPRSSRPRAPSWSGSRPVKADAPA